MGAPPQPLRGARVEGGGGAVPPRTPLLLTLSNESVQICQMFQRS